MGKCGFSSAATSAFYTFKIRRSAGPQIRILRPGLSSTSIMRSSTCTSPPHFTRCHTRIPHPRILPITVWFYRENRFPNGRPKAKLLQIIFYMKLLKSRIISSSYMDTCFIQRRSNEWLKITQNKIRTSQPTRECVTTELHILCYDSQRWVFCRTRNAECGKLWTFAENSMRIFFCGMNDKVRNKVCGMSQKKRLKALATWGFIRPLTRCLHVVVVVLWYCL